VSNHVHVTTPTALLAWMHSCHVLLVWRCMEWSRGVEGLGLFHPGACAQVSTDSGMWTPCVLLFGGRGPRGVWFPRLIPQKAKTEDTKKRLQAQLTRVEQALRDERLSRKKAQWEAERKVCPSVRACVRRAVCRASAYLSVPAPADHVSRPPRADRPRSARQ
jgi:hypothetical protein